MKYRKKAILVASFGTTHAGVRDKTIKPLEEQIRSVFPERRFYHCYTSPTVRRLMERREGIRADGIEEALERMRADGMEDILIFITHVIPGIESERLARQAEEFRIAHPNLQIRLTKPLLREEEDFRVCAGIMMEEYGKYLTSSGKGAVDESGNRSEDCRDAVTEIAGDKRRPEAAAEISDSKGCGEEQAQIILDGGGSGKTEHGEKTALIFFGHGTPHAGDGCYERLETALRLEWKNMSDRKQENSPCSAYVLKEKKEREKENSSPALLRQKDEREQIYVITVEGSRTVTDILPQLKADGMKTVLLIPFLLTAGEHVMHDMAGEEAGSVKSILCREGINAVPVTKGLGEYARIREYYIQRYQ